MGVADSLSMDEESRSPGRRTPLRSAASPYPTTESHAAAGEAVSAHASQRNRSQALLGECDQYGKGGSAVDALQRGRPV